MLDIMVTVKVAGHLVHASLNEELVDKRTHQCLISPGIATGRTRRTVNHGMPTRISLGHRLLVVPMLHDLSVLEPVDIEADQQLAKDERGMGEDIIFVLEDADRRDEIGAFR